MTQRSRPQDADAAWAEPTDGSWRSGPAWWLALLLVVVAGDRLGALALRHAVLRGGARFARLYSGRVPSGVVILGSSRAVNAFYAPDLGARLDLPVTNLGYNGIAIPVAEALVLDLLERNPAPRMVVIEVSCVGVDQEALNDMRLYSAQSSRLRALDAAAWPRPAAAARLVHLFAYDSELALRTLYYLHHGDQGWINHARITPALLAATQGEPDTQLPLHDEDLASLRRVLLELDAHGIPVGLVLAPYLPAHRAHLANLDAWLARVRAAAGPQHPVLDASGALDDPDGFADRIHMNDVGSRRFADQLVAAGFFEPVLKPAP